MLLVSSYCLLDEELGFCPQALVRGSDQLEVAGEGRRPQVDVGVVGVARVVEVEVDNLVCLYRGID